MERSHRLYGSEMTVAVHIVTMEADNSAHVGQSQSRPCFVSKSFILGLSGLWHSSAEIFDLNFQTLNWHGVFPFFCSGR